MINSKVLCFISVLSISLSIAQTTDKLSHKAKTAFEYCKTNGLNTEFCILIDMSIHSGKKRMFIWNFNTQNISNASLCSHGCCDKTWGSDDTKINPKFSNVSESHCSSLGKYKIGKRGYSNWGIHVNYKLHGLESTNKNAFKRNIVLHSWEMVSEEEIFPNGTPEGWGCPAVSNAFMKKTLDLKLKDVKTPPLLWIFN